MTATTEPRPSAHGASLTLEHLVNALPRATEPDPQPIPEVVTVGETSDIKVDRKIYCPDCLGKDGPTWGTHEVYWITGDPERPGRLKRQSVKVAHPPVLKTLSYDARAVR